jgi:hypothetical protein
MSGGTAQIPGRNAGLVRFENGDDLRLAEPGLLRGWSPSRPVALEFHLFPEPFRLHVKIDNSPPLTILMRTHVRAIVLYSEFAFH